MKTDPTKPRVIHLDGKGNRVPKGDERSTGVALDPRDKTVGRGQCGTNGKKASRTTGAR